MPKGRVLVIDDDEDLLMVLKEVIAVSYECFDFLNAQQALEKMIQGERYDCMICDLMMPKMGGIQFYEGLEKIAPEQLSRVIFMTGGSYTSETDAFLKRPEINHFQKPLDIKNLLLVIQKTIKSHQSKSDVA